MQVAARIISAILSVYMILLMIRIMLTWFRNQQGSQFYNHLSAITDPYINWFRRFRFLKNGAIDFSPILGFVFLGFLINLLNNFAVVGSITIGFLLSMVVMGIWSILSFILILFIIFTILRLLTVNLLKNRFFNQISPSIDMIINPVVLNVKRLFFKNKFISYTTQLYITIIVLIVIYIAFNFSFAYLGDLIKRIPF